MSLIYTPLPIEQVLSNMENQEKSQGQEFKEIELEGKKLIVEVSGLYEAKITRLISSDPNDYLDSRFQPGNLIGYYPGLKDSDSPDDQ